MQVLTFASQKGGSGKTTLAGHTAVAAEMTGAGPVALIDTDPQGSLSDWWNERQAETPLFARTTVAQLSTDLQNMRELGIRLVVIDTPPAITSTIADVVRESDLVVIPTRPSPHDLRAAGATVRLVEGLHKPLVFAMNAATRRARITAEAVFALSQHGTLVPTVIHQRTDFAASMIDGRTVMELPSAEASSREVMELWNYLRHRLARSIRAESTETDTGVAIDAARAIHTRPDAGAPVPSFG
ncbi:MAG: AAA family ATPase [Alphaproteobacteria bacterium]